MDGGDGRLSGVTPVQGHPILHTPNRGRAMLRLTGAGHKLCDGLSRRDFLRVGAVGGFGLSLPLLLERRAAAASTPGFGRAKRCVLLFLTGGPSQLDTWDMKPDAPAEVRAPFNPI